MKIEYENFITNIKKSNEIAIFCGAGISMNSGLPSAYQFVKEIINQFDTDLKEADLYNTILNALPFEAVMEKILFYTNSKLLNIFEQGEPNNTHFKIAELIKSNKLKKIITTNFDLLIERALDKYNLTNNIKILYKENDFHTLSDNDEIELIKIHGSISDKATIRTTLSDVAKKKWIKFRFNALRNFLYSGKYDTIIFMGYSFSDYFDIVPYLHNITSKKNIYFINHEGTIPPENLVNLNLIEVECNTDNFINDLPSTSPQRKIKKFNWIDYLINWTNNFSKGKKNFIIGILLNELQMYDLALKYFNISFKSYHKKNNNYEIANSLFHIAQIHQFNRLYLKSLNFYYKSMQKFIEIKNTEMIASIYHQLARVNQEISNYTLSENLFKESIYLKLKIESKKIGNSYHGLAMIKHRQNDLDEALKYYIKAIKYFHEEGFLKNESRTKNQIAQLYHDIENYDFALRYYKEAASNLKKIHDLKGLCDVLVNLSGAYLDLHEKYKDKKYLSKSYITLKELYVTSNSLNSNNLKIFYILKYNSQKANYYLQKKNFQLAKKIYNKSIKICDQNNLEKEKAKLIFNIGCIYNECDDIDTALLYFNQSLLIRKKYKDSKGIKFVEKVINSITITSPN